ncbi:MAG: domain containing protein [Polaromonas sp.]|nr:domain containing protein [Polaromonas sp.]
MATAPLLPLPIHSQRAVCSTCLRPQAACICRWIRRIPHVVEVLILQHPLEAGHAKGSARLLHLSLPHSRMLEGETFSAADLAPTGKRDLLLYPEGAGDAACGTASPLQVVPTGAGDPSGLRLIVLDGTWRKSRKMLELNPALQGLPRLSLRGLPASAYRIRKAHAPDQLSTLEATCAALMQLEPEPEKFQPLLAAFGGFVAQQMGYRNERAEAQPG